MNTLLTIPYLDDYYYVTVTSVGEVLQAEVSYSNLFSPRYEVTPNELPTYVLRHINRTICRKHNRPN